MAEVNPDRKAENYRKRVEVRDFLKSRRKPYKYAFYLEFSEDRLTSADYLNENNYRKDNLHHTGRQDKDNNKKKNQNLS
ncbi:MAG TPA: hypothetical protein VGK06_04870 [Methanosarcina sp.]